MAGKSIMDFLMDSTVPTSILKGMAKTVKDLSLILNPDNFARVPAPPFRKVASKRLVAVYLKSGKKLLPLRMSVINKASLNSSG